MDGPALACSRRRATGVMLNWFSTNSCGQMSDAISLQIPWLLHHSDVALLLMRLLVGAVFVTTGSSHVKDPVTRGKSIGLPPGSPAFSASAKSPAAWESPSASSQLPRWASS